jgi:hypothetical protein
MATVQSLSTALKKTSDEVIEILVMLLRHLKPVQVVHQRRVLVILQPLLYQTLQLSLN